MVTIGVDTECVVVSSSSTQIVCNVGEPPVGDQDLVVNVANLGNSAAFSVQVGNKTKKFSRERTCARMVHLHIELVRVRIGMLSYNVR